MSLKDTLIRHILKTQSYTSFTKEELECKTIDELKKENLIKYILHKAPLNFTYDELRWRAIHELDSIYSEIKSRNRYAIK